MPSHQSLLRLVAQESPAHTAEILGPILALLSGAREALGGDLDKLLILLVVTIRGAQHPQFVEAVRDARARPHEAPVIFPTLGVNIQSVADSIAAPKETIRRKVSELVDAGWIERSGSQLHLTSKGYLDLTGVRELIHNLVAAEYEIVRTMLAAAGPDRV
jgi:hypothetical protein